MAIRLSTIPIEARLRPTGPSNQYLILETKWNTLVKGSHVADFEGLVEKTSELNEKIDNTTQSGP
jgi:hypothetical protein